MSQPFPPGTLCVGLFGPCQNEADPAYTLEDPAGIGPPIPRCKRCACGGDAFINEVARQGKLPMLSELLDAAEILAEKGNTKDRGKS